MANSGQEEGRTNQAYLAHEKEQSTDKNEAEEKRKKQVDDVANNTKLKWSIIKNVLAIAIAFMVLFTSFQSMQSLQSSINQVSGLGTYSLATIYAFLIISSLFSPSLIIKHAGSKWTMVGSMLCYSLFIAAQFHPQFYTLLPAAVVIGFAAAPLWIAKCAYLTKIGHVYATDVLAQTSLVESMVVRFFGIFFLFFQTSLIWGSLISSFYSAIEWFGAA